MDRIYRKSALGDTSALLLAAHEHGADLLWTRYEQQLPLCAFTSNGLNCRKCFQGPCRINPFGDEPSRGVCGADRDQIVMENLFQSTLEGVMESARGARLVGIGGAEPAFPDVAAALSSESKDRLAQAGLIPVRAGDAFAAKNGFFSHKGFLPQTLRELTRLGLINYGFLSQAASILTGADHGAEFHPEGINILIVGRGPKGLTQALERQAARRAQGKRVNLFTQGAHASPLTITAADHGSPDLALGMNVDALIVAPNASWPSVERLAAKYGIPVVLVEGADAVRETASAALDQAVRHAQAAVHGTSAQTIRPGNTREASRLPRGQDVQRALQSGRITGVAALFGEANAKQTFFDRTLALMETAIAQRAMVLLGGDLGAQADALGAELGRRQGAQLAAFAAELATDGLHPITVFGSAFELPVVVSVLRPSGPERGNAALPVVFAFPEFYRAATWASAVSLFSLGFTVQIGTSLPFWGSPWLAGALKTEWQKITGGTLLAGPALLEPRAQAEELAACFKAGRSR